MAQQFKLIPLVVDLKQWNDWCIVDLFDLAKEYYDGKLSYLKQEIEIEKSQIESFQQKIAKLEDAEKSIKRNNRKWNVDEVRNEVEIAIAAAWSIRLHQDIPGKQDDANKLSQTIAGLKEKYESMQKSLGTKKISIDTRKEAIKAFLDSTV